MSVEGSNTINETEMSEFVRVVRPHEQVVVADETESCVKLIKRNWQQILGALGVIIALLLIVFLPMFMWHKMPYACRCSVSNNSHEADQRDYPVLVSVIQANCSKEGHRNCFKFCSIMADISPSTYERLICEQNPNATYYLGTLYYWDCGYGEWEEAHPLWHMCCNNSIPVFCNKHDILYE